MSDSEVKKDTVIDVVEPPPPFTPYEAEYSETDDGDIISHDAHLNQDGEALHQFLLTHAKTRPQYTVNVIGTHRETRERRVTKTVNGRTQTHTERYTVTVKDFDFLLDLTPYLAIGPTHVSVPDEVPAFRGSMVPEVLGAGKATRKEVKETKEDRKARRVAGVAPWANLDGTARHAPYASSKTIRDWADQYGSSPKLLTEFVYTKYVYGWNQSKLETALQGLVRASGYSHDVEVVFSLTKNRIIVRSDNRLSRMLSSTGWCIILWITLIYPFIWLFRRFAPHGGGRWDVVGGAYGLVEKEPASEDDVPTDEQPSLAPRVLLTDEGLMRVHGYREGEWFRKWEDRIRTAVVSREQSNVALTLEGLLDG